MSLTKFILHGDNYDVWAKAIITGLEGKNKLGFVTGDIPQPSDPNSSEFIAWWSNTSTICGWIFNSVDDKIQPSIASHKVVRDMWLDLKERYGLSNGPRRHQLKTLYHTLRQQGMNIVSYYNQFKSLWDELYGSDDVTCGCKCEAAPKIRARFESEKTHDLLLGLDDVQFSSIRTQILGMEPFPVLNKAFSIVSQSPSYQRPYCTHCHRHGHVYDTCYQRIGFPPSTQGRGRGRGGRGRGGARDKSNQHIPLAATSSSVPATANAATVADTPHYNNNSSAASSSTPVIPGLNSDQVQRLLSLITTSPSSEQLHGKQSVWLFDSGASHHMIGAFDCLFDCSDLPPHPVSLPDGVQTSAVK
ncbi:Gag polyprotein [Bienertia sinuspersici]